MTKRMRMIAGPNGSGKSTLMHRLANDYAVNFYDVLNADDIFAEVRQSNTYQPKFSIDEQDLREYAKLSSYSDETKEPFLDGTIEVANDSVQFKSSTAVNSYTIALLTNFLQNESIRQGRSFSQETVFSHPSKIEALKTAKDFGYRTYLYFVATNSPLINFERVHNRSLQGGHDVPVDKIESRYLRSIEQLPLALPYLSRAYFFDNSCDSMRYLAQWNPEDGLVRASDAVAYPKWLDGIGHEKP